MLNAQSPEIVQFSPQALRAGLLPAGPPSLHMTFQICLPPALASISILKFIFVTQMTKILMIVNQYLSYLEIL